MSFTAFADEIPADKVVINAAFWPDINLSIFQDGYRLPGDYRQGMIEERVELAMIWANDELYSWRVEQQGLGATKLTEVETDPALAIGTKNRLSLLYVRAVSCYAKGLLLTDYKTLMRKSDAQNDAKESEETADKWFELATSAVSSLQGKLKIHAEAL